MKKKLNKKLILNKQKISELSNGNMKNIKGGRGVELCLEVTLDNKCISEMNTCYCPV